MEDETFLSFAVAHFSGGKNWLFMVETFKILIKNCHTHKMNKTPFKNPPSMQLPNLNQTINSLSNTS